MLTVDMIVTFCLLYAFIDLQFLHFNKVTKELTLKSLRKIVTEDILNCFNYFSEKIRLGILCELSAKQTIHMKWQVLFSRKNRNKNK